MTKRNIVSISAFAAAAFLGTTAFAGTVDKSKASKAPVEVAKESCITGDIGVDFTTNYISRGVPQENQGVIAQPYSDLYFRIYEGSGALSKVTANLSTWSSIHTHRSPFAGPTTREWYEFDYMAGLTFQFGKLSVTPSFLALLSPNGSFGDNYNFNLALSYDDSEALGAYALHPHVTFLHEIQGKAGTGTSRGQYYEIGIAPSYATGALTLSLPITAGFGSSGFYGSPIGGGDDNFGFLSVAIAGEYALGFVPECLGAWALKANVTYYHLGLNDNSRANTAESGIVNGVTNGNEDQWGFGGGLVVRF